MTPGKDVRPQGRVVVPEMTLINYFSEKPLSILAEGHLDPLGTKVPSQDDCSYCNLPSKMKCIKGAYNLELESARTCKSVFTSVLMLVKKENRNMKCNIFIKYETLVTY